MATRYRPGISIVTVVYIIIGVFVAWDRGYLNPDLVRRIVSALLAVFLWFLLLLGVDMHINA